MFFQNVYRAEKNIILERVSMHYGTQSSSQYPCYEPLNSDTLNDCHKLHRQLQNYIHYFVLV